MYNGRFSIGTILLMIFKAPWNKPAAPHPAIARPMMNIVELDAAAQMTEPAVLLLVESPTSAAMYHKPSKAETHAR